MVNQNTALKLDQWVDHFDKRFLQELNGGNPGELIFRNLALIDILQKKDELSPLEMAVLRMKNNYLIQEATDRYLPIIRRLAAEKRRTVPELQRQ